MLLSMRVLVWRMMSLAMVTGEDAEQSCTHLVVSGADFADCNGEYLLSTASVSWAPLRPVYRHVLKNR